MWKTEYNCAPKQGNMNARKRNMTDDEIKQNQGGLTQYQLAEIYGVKRPCIAKIQRGTTWGLNTHT